MQTAFVLINKHAPSKAFGFSWANWVAYSVPFTTIVMFETTTGEVRSPINPMRAVAEGLPLFTQWAKR
jgi:hypothetical protein